MRLASRFTILLFTVSAAFVASAGNAQQATGDVEHIDSFLAAFVYLIRAMQAGGPWVMSLGLLCIGANVAWLIYWSPHIAKPIGAAISMARGGRSEREGQLETDLAEALRELTGLRGQVKLLEDRDEELRRAVSALVETLEAQMKRAGVDTDLLDLVREMLMHEGSATPLTNGKASVA